MAILEIRKVGYQVKKQVIIKETSFLVEEGEFVTLTGASGSGKSTLLKIIASLLTASTGEVYFEERAQSEYVINEYRQQVSYCFQQPSLFGTTVQDNLEFPFIIRNQPFSYERAITLLESAALSEDFLEKAIIDLSGGEKQRVALIRNLMFLPKILLLDEVTAGLDTTNKELIHQMITTLQGQGMTILQVTHDSTEIAQSQRILQMEAGILQ